MLQKNQTDIDFQKQNVVAVIFPKTKKDYKIIPKKLKKENDSLILEYEKYWNSKKDIYPITAIKEINLEEMSIKEKEMLKLQSDLIFKSFLVLVIRKTECKNLIVREI